MDDINWNEVSCPEPYSGRPAAGGYAARIIAAEDLPERKYLKISWDFTEGPMKDSNRRTWDMCGFWPTRMIRSYKTRALGYFKRFKEAVEASNPGYCFCNDPISLTGRHLGIVLGEEEYRKADGTIGRRLYVADTLSLEELREGRYRIPELKLLQEQPGLPF